MFLKKDHFVYDEAEESQSVIMQWIHVHDYSVVHDDEYLTIFK